MGISAPLILLLCSVGVSLAEKDAYIMVELDPAFFGRTLVKRQTEYDQRPQPQQHQPQYAAQPSQGLDQQVTPEYYNYLQQLQQLTAQSEQPSQQQQYSLPQQPQQYSQPQLLQQSLQSRAPQSFQSQQPPRRPVIPEDQRILQESLARRPVLNQEREDQRRQHLISLGIDPTALRRQQLRENIARQAAQQAAHEAARKQSSTADEQLAAFFADAGPQQIVPHIQIQPIPQSIPVHQRQEDRSPQLTPDQNPRVSYSQLSFGGNSLQKPRLLQDSQQQLLYQQQPVQRAAQYPHQPQAQPQQQVSYETEYVLSPQRAATQQESYKPRERPQQVIFHAPQQVTYIQPAEQQSQLPQQYLIETTKQQEQPSPVLIPRRQQFSYRPQANYQDLHASIAAHQQQAQLSRQQLEAATSPAPPSRSAIFVTTARTPTPKAYSALPEYRIAPGEKQRPLSQSELNALINAGFSVSPTPNQPEYQQYFRGLSKRQNLRPPRVGRVPLSDEDRQELAKSGIRSLYRVQGAESRDAPITYVLALDNQKRDTDKA